MIKVGLRPLFDGAAQEVGQIPAVASTATQTLLFSTLSLNTTLNDFNLKVRKKLTFDTLALNTTLNDIALKVSYVMPFETLSSNLQVNDFAISDPSIPSPEQTITGGGFAVFPQAEKPKKKKKKEKKAEKQAKLPSAKQAEKTDTVIKLEPVGDWLELELNLREVTENLAKLALEEQEQLRLALEIADEVLAKSIAEAIINEQFQKINELLQQEEDAIKANAIKQYLAVVLQAQKKARKERNRKRIIQLMMIGEI